MSFGRVLVLVLSDATNEPLEGARVVGCGNDLTTGASGGALVERQDLVCTLTITKDGYKPVELVINEAPHNQQYVRMILAEQPALYRPDGPTIIVRHAFADNGGQFPYLGASGFVLPFYEKHDPAWADHCTDVVARERCYHGIRTGAGFQVDSFEDLQISPFEVEAIVAYAERAFRRGLRLRHCVFMDGADSPGMDSLDARRRVVDVTIEAFRGHREKFSELEVLNEGFEPDGRPRKGMSIEEVREHGARLYRGTGIPVSLSDTRSDELWVALYGGSGVPLATQHYERDLSADGGEFEYLSKPSEAPDDRPRIDNGPTAAISGEPRFAGSSGSGDYNVDRLSFAYPATVGEGNAGHLDHWGAGIRLGGQHDRTRLVEGLPVPACYDGHPEWFAVCESHRAMQRIMPRDLANGRVWKGHRVHEQGGPFNYITYRHTYPETGKPDNGPFDQNGEPRRIFKAFVNLAPDGRTVFAFNLRVMREMEIEILAPIRLRGIDRNAETILAERTLQPGDRYTMTPRPPSGWRPDGDAIILVGALL